ARGPGRPLRRHRHRPGAGRPALPGPGRRGRPAGPPHPRADDARRAAGRTRGAAPGPVPLAPAPPRPGRRPAGRRPATHPPPTPDPDEDTMTHRPHLPPPEHLELLEDDAPDPLPHAWLVALVAWDHDAHAPLHPRTPTRTPCPSAPTCPGPSSSSCSRTTPPTRSLTPGWWPWSPGTTTPTPTSPRASSRPAWCSHPTGTPPCCWPSCAPWPSPRRWT